MMPLVEKIGERIRALREERGLSQEEAGVRAGRGKVYWGKVERGEQNVCMGTIERMSYALDVDPVEILAFVATPEEGEERILIDMLHRMTPAAREQIMSLARLLSGPE